MSDWIDTEKWWYKHTCSIQIKEELCKISDLTDVNLELIIDKFAELHVMMLMSGYQELSSEFKFRFTENIADTKTARILHKGVIVSMDGESLVVLKKDFK